MSVIGTYSPISSGDSYTAESGADRLVVFLFNTDGVSSTNLLNEISFGGVVADILVNKNEGSEIAAIAVVPEVSIPSGSNVVVASTVEGTDEGLSLYAMTLGGRSQQSPYGFTSFGGYSTVESPWSGSVPSNSGADAVIAITGGVPSRTPSSIASGDFLLLDGSNAGTFAKGLLASESSAGGSLDYELNWSSGNTGIWVAASFDSATAPTISTSPSTAYPGETITITGTNFGATQGTGGVTIGGVAQTITSWSDTSIQITTVLGNNSYGTGKTLEVTNDSAETASTNIELVADTANGFGYVTMSSPNTTEELSVAYNVTPTVVTGDQFEWEDFNSLGNLTIDAQGFVSNVDAAGTFRGRFWDASDQTWGSVEEFTVTADGGVVISIPSARAVGFRNAIRSAARGAADSSIH